MPSGGKRKGAGRPPIDPQLVKIPVGYKLPRWLVEWIRKQDTPAAQLIENALIMTIKGKKMEANINNLVSIAKIYSVDDHKEAIEGNDKGGEYTNCVIVDCADDAGNFYIHYGSYLPKNDHNNDLRLPCQGSYNTMIGAIINAAKTGEY